MKEVPSVTCLLAHSMTIAFTSLYDALQTRAFKSLPHLVDLDHGVISLAAGNILLVLGLKCCELCGNWRLVRQSVRGLEISTAGICVYGVSMGLLVPLHGKAWVELLSRLAVGFQIASLVINAGTWLDAGDGEVTARASEDLKGVVEEKREEEVIQEKQEDVV